MVIEYIVSNPTARATAAIQYCWLSTDALITNSFAQNPDSGGKPASEKAGTKNSAASSGCSRYTPPRVFKSLDPDSRSAAPATKNRLALTMM